MTAGHFDDAKVELSVVIPSYNSASWLPSTLDALAEAVRTAGIAVQVVVVDDGSTDSTADVVLRIAESFPGRVELVTQENRGRFLARWSGLEVAQAEWVLLLDSRVLIDAGSIAHVRDQITADPSRVAWNAHVGTDPNAPLVGLFWDVPVYIFWGRYLRSPRPFDLTASTFDQAPKGTGLFFARKDILRAAFEYAWPAGDVKLVSDDTKILRRIAEAHTIRLDPSFSGLYRPRTKLGAFFRHTLDRGTLFVDSYAGTSFTRSAVLVGLAVAPPVVVAVLVALLATGRVALAVAAIAGILAAVLSPVALAAVNNCPRRSLLAFVLLLPAFILPFWLGVLRGFAIHRRSFRGRGAHGQQNHKEKV